ncbi:hypothetical protein GCM10010468_80080 [Actinocorallia longicatena]|uniref:HTH tetR-type domain-containing protein n=1 Tax=Actinocorallia longicatena TaxID=111803 RepID=A0ABP6QMI2_9ACTN
MRAASELFSTRAYDEVTTAEIARRAGVAYGLIAHHFVNKRGLYLATVNAAAERLRAVQEAPPEGGTPAELLRNAVARHVAYMDDNSAGFLALMRGGNGSDPEVRAIIEGLRWEGAARILRALGAAEPVRPTLRAAMRGWVGLLDELIIDLIHHHDVPREHLADLAATALAATLRRALALDPEMGIEASAIASLDER